MTCLENPPTLSSKIRWVLTGLGPSISLSKCEMGFIKSCPVLLILPSGSKLVMSTYWDVMLWDVYRGRLGSVHSLPVLLPCFTSTPYDMFWITHQVLRKMDYSERIYNTSGTEVKTCGWVLQTYAALRKPTEIDLNLCKAFCVAFLTGQTHVNSTSARRQN